MPAHSLLFEDYPLWFNVTAAVVFAMAAASLVTKLVVRGTRVAARSLLGHEVDLKGHGSLAAPLRLVRAVVFLLVTVVLLFPALKLVGVQTTIGLNPEALGRWILESGLRVTLIVLVSWLVMRIVRMVVLRFEQQVGEADTPDARERAKRARTLGTLILNTVGALVTGIGLLMVLRELNLDITPILTGAGIVGLAVGFGAQTLVKDVISGFFLILEDQVRVGDVAAINGTSGLVEAITLRTIVLRDGTGAVHVFPNGSVTTLSNMTKDFSYYMIDLAISWDEDPDRAIAALKRVGAALRQDPRFAPQILDDLEVFGVDTFADGQVIIKLRIKTLPQKQWDVGRELRLRIKKEFDEERIAMPSRALTLKMDQMRQIAERTSAAVPATHPPPPTP
jgi:small conductance mechanosensitive channel